MIQKSAVIIDDERPARAELILLLKSVPELKVVGEADNIKSAVEVITRTKPDIVFLDIQLLGENGFDLLHNIAVDFKIVFVTAYDEYAIKAYDVNASDYLLKPVDPTRLAISIKRIFGQFENSGAEIKRFKYNDSIFVKLNNRSALFIEISTISIITSVGNYSKLITADGKKFHILKTIKQWEQDLPVGFFARLHRSTIVNIKHISKIENYSKSVNMAYMKNTDTPIRISRNCFKNLKESSLPK